MVLHPTDVVPGFSQGWEPEWHASKTTGVIQSDGFSSHNVIHDQEKNVQLQNSVIAVSPPPPPPFFLLSFIFRSRCLNSLVSPSLSSSHFPHRRLTLPSPSYPFPPLPSPSISPYPPHHPFPLPDLPSLPPSPHLQLQNSNVVAVVPSPSSPSPWRPGTVGVAEGTVITCSQKGMLGKKIAICQGGQSCWGHKHTHPQTRTYTKLCRKYAYLCIKRKKTQTSE